MATAKTASKNNPQARASAKSVFYQNKKVVPVLFISEDRKYMAAQFESGDMPMGKDSFPIPWSDIK